MAFTHTPFPKINSERLVEKYGSHNPTRPYKVVAKYLEDLFTPYLNLVTFNTTVEALAKVGEERLVTFRQSGRKRQDEKEYDYWWKERFSKCAVLLKNTIECGLLGADAVITATGNYLVTSIPSIPGLADFQIKYPERLEHSEVFHNANDYVNKSVVVGGGSISASDYVIDLHNIVTSPLHLF
jgi:thioredoxin reductase